MTVEGERLLGLLKRLDERIASVERSSRSPQLPWSVVDVNIGRGAIKFVDGEEERAIVGRQPDGTVTIVHSSSPTLPIVPKDPVLTPTLAGVEVKCTGFVEAQFANFSHVNVYCDTLLVGSIIKVPGSYIVAPLDYTPHNFQLSSVNLSGDESPKTPVVSATPVKVVGSDITDGIISEVKLANDAVTAAKIAANAITETKIANDSVTTQKIIANAITSVLIAADAVSANKIAANAVTADKIQALAITADKIAANAITAGKIQAGSVSADKLAAQIILATTAFIAGNPTGARVVIDSTGVSQYNANGQMMLNIGATPSGNFITIPDDDGTTLAAIDNDGTITTRGINIMDTNKDQTTINGVSLFEILENGPRGIVYRCYHPNGAGGSTPLPTTTSHIGLVELKTYLQGGRAYRIATSSMYTTQPDGTECEMFLKASYHATDPNLARPTLSSPTYGSTMRAKGFGDDVILDHPLYIAPQDEGYWYFLLSLFRQVGTGIVGVGNYLHFYVEDLGVFPVATGGKANGTGTDSSTPQQFTSTYPATWGMLYHPSLGNFNGGLMQGWISTAGHVRSMMGFNSNTIISDLNGAAVSKIELYVKLASTKDISNKTTIVNGYHDWTAAPGTFQQTLSNQHAYTLSKDVGVWVNLGTGTTLVNGLKTGSIKGFTLDSSMYGTGDIYYGELYGVGNATDKPVLRITYTK